MAAYLIIVNGALRDEPRFAKARQLAAEAIREHGGRFLVRGSEIELREGDWIPEHLVVVEFDSVEDARVFLASPDYHRIRKFREGTVNVGAVVAKGV